ncbi:MAG: hypothetical protein AAGK02_12080, partial [Pseudomonadota bacterium]
TDEGEVRLQQTDKYIYGDLGNQGTVEGLVSQDTRTVRGVFQKGDGTTGYFEWRLGNRDNFNGHWSATGESLPVWNSGSTRWRGTHENTARPQLAVYSGNGDAQTFFGSQPVKYTDWAGPFAPELNASSGNTGGGITYYPRPVRPTPTINYPERDPIVLNPVKPGSKPAQPDADTGVQGMWTVDVKGTEYGPFKDRQQVFAFSQPDEFGIVTGVSVGRNSVVFFGKLQDGRNRKLRGVWMETNRRSGEPTGRWGLMEVRTGGEPASSAQIFFSIGYRRPQKAFTGRYPGQVGMEAVGQKVTAGPVTFPSVSEATAQWRSLITKRNPYPAVEGIWPGPDIHPPIRRWIYDGKPDETLCSAGCLGKEPTRLSATHTATDIYKKSERRTERGGKAGVAIVIVDQSDGTEKRTSAKRIYDVSRADSWPNTRDRGVQFSPQYRTQPCGKYRRIEPNAKFFALPAGAWSDPLSDIRLHGQFNLIEFGLTNRGNTNFIAGTRIDSFKSAIQTARTNGPKAKAAGEAHNPRAVMDYDTYCISHMHNVPSEKDRKDDSIDMTIRYEVD